MVLEEDYNSGLDAFLSGKGDAKEVLKFYRTISYYSLYLLPFVGFAIERSKPKEKRTKLGTIVSDLGIAVPLAKLAIVSIPYIIHKTNKNKEDSIKDKNSDQVEQTIENYVGLEKTTHYYDINRNY